MSTKCRDRNLSRIWLSSGLGFKLLVSNQILKEFSYASAFLLQFLCCRGWGLVSHGGKSWTNRMKIQVTNLQSRKWGWDCKIMSLSGLLQYLMMWWAKLNTYIQVYRGGIMCACSREWAVAFLESATWKSRFIKCCRSQGWKKSCMRVSDGSTNEM